MNKQLGTSGSYGGSISPTNMFMDDKGISNLANSKGLYIPEQLQLFDKINIFGYFDLYDRLDGLKEFVFFTKPEFNIFKDSAGSTLNERLEGYPIIADAHERYNDVLALLDNTVSTGSPVNNLLYNKRRNTIDLPAIVSKETASSTNVYGTKITYRKNSYSSDENFEFSIDFADTASTEVYHFFKLWDELNNLRSVGIISPREENITKRRDVSKIAIYKFIVEDDFSSIVFYAKYIGARPTGCPREAFSEAPTDGSIVYSVPWKADFVVDNNPLILEDFNILMGNKAGSPKKLFDQTKMEIDGSWARSAYIEKKNTGDTYNRNNYKLKFYD